MLSFSHSRALDRCRDAVVPGSRSNSPLGEEGAARRQAQTYGSASVAGHGGRLLGAPHALTLVRA